MTADIPWYFRRNLARFSGSRYVEMVTSTWLVADKYTTFILVSPPQTTVDRTDPLSRIDAYLWQ